MLYKKLLNFKIKKCGQIYVHTSPVFSYWLTFAFLSSNFMLWHNYKTTNRLKMASLTSSPLLMITVLSFSTVLSTINFSMDCRIADVNLENAYQKNGDITTPKLKPHLNIHVHIMWALNTWPPSNTKDT